MLCYYESINFMLCYYYESINLVESPQSRLAAVGLQFYLFLTLLFL